MNERTWWLIGLKFIFKPRLLCPLADWLVARLWHTSPTSAHLWAHRWAYSLAVIDKKRWACGGWIAVREPSKGRTIQCIQWIVSTRAQQLYSYIWQPAQRTCRITSTKAYGLPICCLIPKYSQWTHSEIILKSFWIVWNKLKQVGTNSHRHFFGFSTMISFRNMFFT